MALPSLRGRRLPLRSTQLIVGLVLYGFAIALIVRGQIGAAPWDVLTQGIALHTGLSFGLITILTSGVVLLLWIPLRQWPGIGTVLNALIIGPAADLGLALVPADMPLWLRIGSFAVGMLLLAVATGLYVGARLGPGPRDGLMTGLNRRLGIPIWIARTAVEVTVVTIGWFLGGNVGIGTLIFALGIGPLCQWTLRIFTVRLPERAAEPRSTDSQPVDPTGAMQP